MTFDPFEAIKSIDGASEVISSLYAPLERLAPSDFAARYRDVRGGPFPGPWSNDNGPYLVGIMDAVQEAIESNRFVVNMKSAQGGGTEALGINAVAWLLTFYPGPYLYLTAKDEIADELSRDRWEHTLKTCEPIKRKHLAGKKYGEKIQVKRFTDAKLTLSGARSPNNYISNPYRGVVFDELDAIFEELPDGADPVATILERLTAWAEGGATMMIAFAHPSSKERGAGELYYDLSDQRRGHVECPHCKAWIAPLWEHVKVVGGEGQSPAAAERDPACYYFAAPCCGAIWTEADRLRAIQRVEQRSTLAPEVAAKKKWIGVHFWQFFMRSKSVRVLAEKFVEALASQKNGDDSKMRVFVNKVCGDCFETRDKEITIDLWEKLAIPESEAGTYKKGQVPLEVQWLTSGQDSRLDELHWSVWGWGLVRAKDLPSSAPPLLLGWLVDWGILPGPRMLDRARQTLRADDLFVLDQVIYGQYWPSVGGALQFPVSQGLHDSGWQPTAVYQYCRTKPGVAFPSKGSADDDHSKAPPVTWTGAFRYKVGDQEVMDPVLKRADLNTFALKGAFFGMTEGSFVDTTGRRRTLLSLPRDVSGEVLAQLSSERLIRDERGRKKWVRRGPNHFLDCAIMSYATALNVHASQLPTTAREASVAEQVAAQEKIGHRTQRKIRTKY